MKKYKKISVVCLAALAISMFFTSLTFAFAAQQPTSAFQIQSLYNQDSNSTIDANGKTIQIPYFPKINAYAVGNDNIRIPIHYKATHKLLSKKIENGTTTYQMETDIDFGVRVKRQTGSQSNNLLSFIVPNVAYANPYNNPPNSDSHSTMHEYYRLGYYYETNQYGQRFFQYADMHAYWARDNESYSINSAQFKAFMCGGQWVNYKSIPGGQYQKTFNGATFVPQWTSSSNYLNTSVYYDTQHPYVTWPYVYPDPDYEGPPFGTCVADCGYWNHGNWVHVYGLNPSIAPY